MAVKVGSSGWSLRFKSPGAPERAFPISVNWSYSGGSGHAHAFVGRPGGGVAEAGAPIVIKRSGGVILAVEVGAGAGPSGSGRSVKSAVEDWASHVAGEVVRS